MVKRKSQFDHDRIVKRVAVHLRNEGHGNVKADVDGYPTPAVLQKLRQTRS